MAVLSGQSTIVENFIYSNSLAWKNEGTSWPDSSIYQLDGYTLVLTFDIKDQQEIALCV